MASLLNSEKDGLTQLKDKELLRTCAYIDGQWRTELQALPSFPVANPATQARITTVANTPLTAVESAILVADKAGKEWRKQTGAARARILRRWFELLLAHQDDLALLLTAEQGKPLAEAKGEIVYAASFLEWFAEEAKRINGDILTSPWPNKRLLVNKQAIGVCAAITPWNFPIAMITRKVAPAIAAGCSIVVKPAEQTPLSALALAELAARAGVPPGVFNVLPADAEQSIAIGKIFCASNTIRHLSFTGSTAVGRILMAQCAPTIKKMSLELGGLAPFIVFDDADIESAVAGAIASKFRNSGQTCVCTNRFYIHEAIYDEFLEKLTAATKQLRVGHGLQTGIEIGPLINEAAVEQVEAHIHDALAHGAQLICGGQRHPLGGTFFEPTILSQVSAQMRVMQEETFGPVAALCSFKSEEEVIAAANASHFGLAAYFYTRDIARVWRVSDSLESGMVGINTGLLSTEVAPFGGVKHSGMGREGSQYGIDEYLEMKYLCLGDQ